MGRPKDLPPSYEETVASDPNLPAASRPAPPPPPPATTFSFPHLPDAPIPESQPYHSVHSGNRDSSTITLAPSLSEDASSLHALITQQAEFPPRPYLTVRGSHTETRHDHHRKEDRKETIVDFSFKVDLYGYIIRHEHGTQQYGDDDDLGLDLDPTQDGWHVLSVVRDNDTRKTYRGGRFKSETWSGRRKGPLGQRIRQRVGERLRSRFVQLEEGLDHEATGLVRQDEGGPSLMGWCERYCDDPSSVKSFKFSRSLVGFDGSVLISSLTSHLRSLHYRGDISITVDMANRDLIVYNPHWVNKLRNNAWVYYLCIILQVWILAWPIIFLLERRYDIVRSVWYFSRVEDGETRYARHRDEAAIADELAPAVTQAALERNQEGRILTAPEMQLLDSLGRERRERGVVVMQWDRFLGWGGDNYS
ncbi:uncharacterized protein BO87DRAFT_428586 [Aspergillus neoniger CBS 115656]|uniref:Uncharacterized protein n=1 Tax=Aspergillus neoniger (strain CBS 115656) TaxID=1448310 RepID=A0A318YC76_ASPNB|nr:hypothetical protein BO87DRAFT_428586 [Aspergillus neoniger CBS 115656]PYH31584.1 hypothetical protein BO87DRAFT_428586 [Aspergillus neoniger CBS 115656]